MIIKKFIVMLSLAMSVAFPAISQSETQFVAAFAGDWDVYDQSFRSIDQTCSIKLSAQVDNQRYRLTHENCAAALSELSHWKIVDGQLQLSGVDGQSIASLGGTQRRMTGVTNTGEPIIIERKGVIGAAATIEKARLTKGCYYLGFTKECASAADLAAPTPSADKQVLKLQLLTNLNVRSEARDDAPVIGVAPRNSCIEATTCVTASDGLWCKAQFGDTNGWLRKLALRKERWAVVTYLNQCEG